MTSTNAKEEARGGARYWEDHGSVPRYMERDTTLRCRLISHQRLPSVCLLLPSECRHPKCSTTMKIMTLSLERTEYMLYTERYVYANFRDKLSCSEFCRLISPVENIPRKRPPSFRAIPNFPKSSRAAFSVQTPRTPFSRMD